MHFTSLRNYYYYADDVAALVANRALNQIRSKFNSVERSQELDVLARDVVFPNKTEGLSGPCQEDGLRC